MAFGRVPNSRFLLLLLLESQRRSYTMNSTPTSTGSQSMPPLGPAPKRSYPPGKIPLRTLVTYRLRQQSPEHLCKYFGNAFATRVTPSNISMLSYPARIPRSPHRHSRPGRSLQFPCRTCKSNGIYHCLDTRCSDRYTRRATQTLHY